MDVALATWVSCRGCIHVCVFVYLCICICMRAYLYLCMYLCIYGYMGVDQHGL